MKHLKRMMNRRFSLLLFFLLLGGAILADDIGIVETRFFEEGNNTYVLEVDVPPNLLNTIKKPILPKRCQFLGEPEKIITGPMMVVRFRFSSGDKPLLPEDELVLYWQRTGIVMTAYWLDGASKRVFLNRDLAGILVPIGQLRDVEITNSILIKKSISDTFSHLKQYWLIYLLFILAAASINSKQQALRLLFAYVAGHGFSLVATDFGFPSFFPSGIVLLTCLTALMILLALVQSKAEHLRFWPVLLVLGFLQGLGYQGPSFDQPVELLTSQLIIARFVFSSIITLCTLILGGIWWLNVASRKNKSQKGLIPGYYLAGGLTIAFIIALIPGILTPDTEAPKKQLSINISESTGLNGSSRMTSRAVAMGNPLLGFMTVTPFEVRIEWLVRVKDLNPQAVTTEKGDKVIPLENQIAFKEELLEQYKLNTQVTCDDKKLDASTARADFVTLGNYGVTTHDKAIPELIDDAIVGVTLAYAVEEAPEKISMYFDNFSEQIVSVPLAVTDPWGSTPQTLTREQPVGTWNKRMAGFRRPAIEPISIKASTWPIASVILILLVIIMVYLTKKRRIGQWGIVVVALLLVLAIVCYPFIRIAAPASWQRQIVSKEIATVALDQLLINIYRAFDYQTEEAIYDRLAISATGDQLTNIYLEHRSAMELEGRGGARASVDKVEVLDIREVYLENEGMAMDASWAVSGSVSHFGHIHYRKNVYDAIVHIVSVDGIWKISSIDVKEKERIL